MRHIVEITKGFNGDRIAGPWTEGDVDSILSTYGLMFARGRYNRWWNINKVSDNVTIVDFGSHVYFGRVTVETGGKKENKMKKDTKTITVKGKVSDTKTVTVGKKPAVKPMAKTIVKPQTVDVTGMKVLTVTLTDKGTMVIKYVK